MNNGRIAITLANSDPELYILGLDLSTSALLDSRERIKEVVAALRENTSSGDSSVAAIRTLIREGHIKASDITLDENDIARRFLILEGDMIQLNQVIGQAILQWATLYPQMTLKEFFGSDTPKFDLVTLNWHTINELGPEDRKKVLQQIFDLLPPGGNILFETANRDVGQYPEALMKYYKTHPGVRYGVIGDPKPDGMPGLDVDKELPLRNFAALNEYLLDLQSAGFDLDPATDVQYYLVEDKSPTGIGEVTLMEYFITARKPMH